MASELKHVDSTLGHTAAAADAPSDADPAVGRPLGAQLLGWTFTQMLRTMHASWRKDVSDMALLDELIAERQPHILSFWHRKYVALFPILRRRHACVVTTTSPHGHVVASICRHFGNSVIQIPSAGSGTQSLSMIGHAFAQASEAGIAVDGPVGPDHKVKRGAIQLASELGHLIVPMSVASRRKHVLRHRWDRLEIPMMFTRVLVSVGQPIRVPRGLSWPEVQAWRSRLHEVLEAVDQEAEDRVRRR